jgi:hypothetical protein
LFAGLLLDSESESESNGFGFDEAAGLPPRGILSPALRSPVVLQIEEKNTSGSYNAHN